jgi:hypothetical protein
VRCAPIGVDLGQLRGYTSVAVLQEAYWLTAALAWSLNLPEVACWVWPSQLPSAGALVWRGGHRGTMPAS